jgi:imidazolonepropionase-like amidohydrolase
MAVAPTALAQESPVLQIRAKEIVLGDESRVEDGILVIEGGRIARVGRGVEPDPSLPLIEHDGVLTAGMIACQTQSGAVGETDDTQRSFLPEARLVYAFDPESSDFEKALEAGITTMVLTPGGNNVVGGLTAVVKTHGGTVVSPQGHLALSFAGPALGQTTRQQFFFFDAELEPEVHTGQPLAANGGPENTEVARRGSRAPTSYVGALRMLRERFGDPDSVFGSAARGELPVFIEARDRHEVLRAASFAREKGLKGVLYGAPLAGDPGLLGPLKESGLGVVVGPYAVGQLTRSLASVRILQEAGISVGFALNGPSRAADELRFSAVMALGAGADAAAVWRALTVDAAALAGVDARVGSLERGKDADLVLWSGDPLDLGSRVEAVYVDGKLAYTAKKDSRGSL